MNLFFNRYLIRSLLTATIVAVPYPLVADVFQQQASWQVPDAKTQTGRFQAALQQQGVEAAKQEVAVKRFAEWIAEPGADAIQGFVVVASQVVPAVKQVLEENLVDVLQVDDNALDKLSHSIRTEVDIYRAREMTRQRLYDEALPLLARVDAVTTVDPAATLFYRAVCNHWLLNKSAALTDLQKLLENQDACPIRYVRTAQLMLANIKPLKKDSLDEISRLMYDVHRRLDLGRTGDTVQTQEQTVIDKLSKLIKKVEDQQKKQQCNQKGQKPGSGNQSSKPMEDSHAIGGSASGDVDGREISQDGGWGNLPPAKRQEAVQQISRELPTHYRDAIEAYFRKLATDK